MCLDKTGTEASNTGGQEIRRATAVNPMDEPAAQNNRFAKALTGFGSGSRPGPDYAFTPGDTDLFNYKSTGVQSPLLQAYMNGLSPWKRPNSNGLGS